ncbi:hypothetical protein TRICI_003538 [Trichomonascus ciferrii]|uniref:mRNA 3'-end-processing protein RNA14 n=1 Tax=Trichomonascus ciferrii TaxID=44093 RepID=A0A642V3M6_9ASCO|nr:hypothetical protein TRICI_003538 [Trichomonascus ciferrii]
MSEAQEDKEPQSVVDMSEGAGESNNVEKKEVEERATSVGEEGKRDSTARSTPAFLTDSPAPAAQPSTAASSTGKRKRLPQDVVGKLEDRIAEDASDIDAWKELVEEYKKKEKLEELREIYERMLKNFPTSAETWIDYVDTELANGEFYKVEQLFSRCLPKVLNIKLWTHYLGYVRRINNVNSTDGEKARQVISQVYEFVFERLGFDRNSGPLWKEYIEFIKSKEGTTTWEQQQQMDLLRKTYRRAICIPLVNVEDLWHAYNEFETNLNKTTARKFIAEKSAAYMTARSCIREMQNMIGSMDITNTTPYPRRWTKKEEKESIRWFRWLEWEKKNPLGLDAETLKQRVVFTYKQAVMSMRYFPEIWFDAVEYLLSSDQAALANEFLSQAVHANPTSFILFFKKAELEEKEMKLKEMRETFIKLLDNHKSYRTKLEQQLAETEAETGARDADVEKKLETNARDITTVYTAYMKSVKRAEGIKEARKVFSEGRKLPYSTYHIYVASAMMEYYNDKNSGIAGKIFEVGLKRYSEIASYVQEYFNFLIMTNDDTNARALFEKSVIKMSAEEARPLYERFLSYEANYGELAALLRLEKRYKDVYADVTAVSVFSKRYSQDGYDPIKEVDLGERYRGANQSKKQTKQQQSTKEEPVLVDDDVPPAKRTKEENGGEASTTTYSPTFEQAAQNALPAGIMALLKVLPPAASYDTVRFDATKLVKLIKETSIPEHLLDN